MSELVIRAGVSRSSFYRNFDSIDDVLTYGYNELVRTYAHVCPYPYVDFTNVACMAWNLSFWKDHAAHIIAFDQSGLSSAYRSTVFEIGSRDPRAGEASPETAAHRRFAIGAFYAIALDWIADGARESEEAVAQRFCNWIVHGIEE